DDAALRDEVAVAFAEMRAIPPLVGELDFAARDGGVLGEREMDQNRAGGSLEYTRKHVACGVVDSRGDLRIALEHDPAETLRRSEVHQLRLRNFLSGPVHDHLAPQGGLRLSRAGAGDRDGATHRDYDRRDV